MTPKRSRWASMNAQISGAAGRAPARKTRRGSQDLDGALQLAHLAPQLADLLRRLRGQLRADAPHRRRPWRSHLRSVSRLIPSRLVTALIAAYPRSACSPTSRTAPGLSVLVVLDWHERDILPTLGRICEIQGGSHCVPARGTCRRAWSCRLSSGPLVVGGGSGWRGSPRGGPSRRAWTQPGPLGRGA